MIEHGHDDILRYEGLMQIKLSVEAVSILMPTTQMTKVKVEKAIALARDVLTISINSKHSDFRQIWDVSLQAYFEESGLKALNL